MVSIEKWKEHFRRMDQKGHTHEDDIFIVNQSGRGLGRNAYPKHTLYKVRKTIGNTLVTIVSPVVGNLDRAKALMEGGGGGGGGGKRKKKNYKKKKTMPKTVTKKKATKKKMTTKTKKKKGENKKVSNKKKKKTTYVPKCIKK